jgi:hypothetical protein
MQEAMHSFNIKFKMQGFECQLTIRDDERGTGLIVSSAQAAIRMLAGLQGVTPSNGNGRSSAGPEPAASPRAAPVEPVCPTCGKSDELELIPFEKDGKPRQAWKCQRCKKWLPDKKK